MKEISILFNTEMVQAILESRKSMTRRLKGLEKINEAPEKVEFVRFQQYEKDGSYRAIFKHEDADGFGSVKCPYGQPGDVLWVRETSRKVSHYGFEDPIVEFKAGGHNAHCPIPDTDQFIPMTNWKPSIHMPKEAARIWLEVEEIRVERLQDISHEDAIAEGIYIKYWGEDITQPYAYRKSKPEGLATDYKRSEIEAFQDLWGSTYGNDWNIGWNANPWVWVVKFKVLSTTSKPPL